MFGTPYPRSFRNFQVTFQKLNRHPPKSHHPMEKYVIFSRKEICFHITLGEQTTTTFQLQNTSDQPVAYKVKTNQIHRYCVNPNTAVLQPQETVQIAFTQQSFKQLPTDLNDCRDRFLLQVVPYETLPSDLKGDHAALLNTWKTIPKDCMLQKKFAVSMTLAHTAPAQPPPTPVTVTSTAPTKTTPTTTEWKTIPKDCILQKNFDIGMNLASREARTPVKFLSSIELVEKYLSVSSSFLHFEVTLGKQNTAMIHLQNISCQPIACKVKTNEVLRYFVKPNIAVLQPYETIQVEFIQEPFKELPPDLNNCRDKFLLQVVSFETLSADLKNDHNAIFNEWNVIPQSCILQTKIHVSMSLMHP